jgi:hypothetical protein
MRETSDGFGDGGFARSGSSSSEQRSSHSASAPKLRYEAARAGSSSEFGRSSFTDGRTNGRIGFGGIVAPSQISNFYTINFSVTPSDILQQLEYLT